MKKMRCSAVSVSWQQAGEKELEINKLQAGKQKLPFKPLEGHHQGRRSNASRGLKGSIKKKGREEQEKELYRVGTILLFFQLEEPHGVPHGEPAYGYYGEEDEEHVEVVHAHRIGVDDEGTVAVAEPHEAELLLQEAEQQA